MNVPLLDLKAQYRTIEVKIENAIREVLRSQHFIMGPNVTRFEAEIAEYSEVKHAIGVASGSDALLVALMAIGVGPGDEVIVPPYTFFATAGSVARLGARPVFVDILEKTYNIDPALIEAAVTEKTKALIPVHLFGQCADMDAIMKIASKHDLYVIEDAAQSIGSRYKGRAAGSIGQMGCMSFFPSKNLGGFGDGGMITTDDNELAEKARVLRVHGAKPKYFNQVIGVNSRLDALQAAILSVKLARLDEWSMARRRNAAFYDKEFKGTSIGIPFVESYNESIFNQYVINVDQRDELMAYLKEKGIGCEVYYPLSIHRQECFRYLEYEEEAFPVTNRCAERSLAIPVYPELTDHQLRFVSRAILDFYA